MSCIGDWVLDWDMFILDIVGNLVRFFYVKVFVVVIQYVSISFLVVEGWFFVEDDVEGILVFVFLDKLGLESIIVQFKDFGVVDCNLFGLYMGSLKWN